MADTKKTTYRYTPEMEQIIKQGIDRFTMTSSTGHLSMNKFIDICINRTIIENPLLVKKFENRIAKQQKEIDRLEQEFKRVNYTLERLKTLLKERNSNENNIQILILDE